MMGTRDTAISSVSVAGPAARATLAGGRLERVSTALLVWSLVVGLAVAAGSSVIYTTPWGTGTGWDQATYIGVARNLLAGRGLTLAWGMDAGQPLTHYPPLYPSVLALLGITGWDPWVVARYLNAALRSAGLVMVAVLAVRASGGEVFAGAIAAFVILTSVHMEFVHGSAWSEPLFFVLAFPSLALVARYLATGSRLALVGAGILVAGATLTRYAGWTLVPAIALMLLWARRRRAAVVCLSVACLPMALWVLHNALIGGALVGDRGVGWHGVSAQQLGQAVFTAVDWVLPSSAGSRLVSPDGNVYPMGILGVMLVSAALGWWAWNRRRWPVRRDARPLELFERSEADLFRRMLMVFAVVYSLGIVLSMLAVDDLVQLDTRILSPVFLCLVILLSAAAPKALRSTWRLTWLRAPVLLGTASLAVAYGLRFAVLVSAIHTAGVIYSNADWIGSRTMAQVRGLPANATVFSNAPDAIYMLTGRSTFEIPDSGHARAFSSVISDAVERANGPVVLVYFGDPNIAYRRPVPVDQVQQWLPARLTAGLPDGQIYDLVPDFNGGGTR
jgi:hypothetical protein